MSTYETEGGALTIHTYQEDSCRQLWWFTIRRNRPNGLPFVEARSTCEWSTSEGALLGARELLGEHVHDSNEQSGQRA